MATSSDKVKVMEVYDMGRGATSEGRYQISLECGHGDFVRRAPKIGSVRDCPHVWDHVEMKDGTVWGANSDEALANPGDIVKNVP